MAAQRRCPTAQPPFQLPSGSQATKGGPTWSLPSSSFPKWALGRMTQVAAVSTTIYFWKLPVPLGNY